MKHGYLLCSAAIAALMLVASFSVLSVLTDSPENQLQKVRISGYTSHAPIYISGNGDFTNASGVVWGSGTTSDPYIIRGWEIDATGYEDAIYILYSNVYFEVMDCHVYNADGYGINLYGVTNGLVFNNSCTGSLIGILIQDSGTNTVSNNSISNNADAGIYLVSSTGMILRNNTFVNNGIYMSGSYTHDIDTSNTVNGKPVYYYKYQIGGTVPAGAGQVILASCQNMVIENQCINEASSGIMLAGSSNNIIRNNTCSGNSQHGIGLQYSNSNILFNNSLSSNGVGIYVYSSSNNIVSNSNCSDNQKGMQIHYSSSNAISNSTCSNNTDCGIELWDSSSNTFFNNTCSNNIHWGMIIYSGSSDMVWNNTFYHNNGAGDIYDPSHVQAYSGGGNSWNSPEGYGNYWSDWTGPDADMNGIVDVPYDIAGSAGAKDYYPLTTPQVPIPEFGMMPFVVMVLLLVIVLGLERRRETAKRP